METINIQKLHCQQQQWKSFDRQKQQQSETSSVHVHVRILVRFGSFASVLTSWRPQNHQNRFNLEKSCMGNSAGLDLDLWGTHFSVALSTHEQFTPQLAFQTLSKKCRAQIQTRFEISLSQLSFSASDLASATPS